MQVKKTDRVDETLRMLTTVSNSIKAILGLFIADPLYSPSGGHTG